MKELTAHTACLSLEEIQHYAKDRLDEAARFRVENHLLDCALCRAALDSYMANPDETLGADVALLQQQIQSAVRPKIITMKRNRFNSVAAAVALLVLAGAAAAYWQHTRYDRLYASVFSAPKANEVIAMRSENGVQKADPDLQEALDWYKAGDFAAASQSFDRYLQGHPDDFQAGLYAGIAALSGGYPEKAIEQLTAVSINDPQLFDEANWYLALAFLKQKKLADAKAILENLVQQAEPVFAGKAKGLLERLE
jgi:tetratricopeptide (TPR) repeat protein